MEEREMLARKRYLGSIHLLLFLFCFLFFVFCFDIILTFIDIKFIGELFKADMLTEKIMNSCIMKLLGEVKNPSEEDILTTRLAT